MRPARVCVFLLVAMATVRALSAQDHGYTPADIENGGRLFQSNCAGCHGQTGDGVAGIDLGRGQFRRATSDTDLIKVIQTGIAGTTMPSHNFTDQQAATVVAYIRNMSTLRAGAAPNVLRGVGDAARGKALFDGKGQCATCHRVNGSGSRLVPDLERSGRDPAAARTAPGAARSGRDDARRQPSVPRGDERRDDRAGRLLNQDTFSVQLIDAKEQLVSLPKTEPARVRIHQDVADAVVRGRLTLQEVDDLVSYLVR